MPDLTFSEMTFLNPRKDKLEGPVETTDMKKRRKRDKTADNEAEISRYFASTRARDANATTAQKGRAKSLEPAGPPEKYSKRSDAERYAYLDRSSVPPVELPERPFLGFGSAGGSLVSPVRSELPVSSPRRAHPIQRGFSPGRSTSRFSWSKTRSPSLRLSRRRDTESVAPASQKSTTGVQVIHKDNAVNERGAREHRDARGRREDVMKTPGDGASNDLPEHDPHPPPSGDDPKQQKAQNIWSELVEESKTQQPQETTVVNGTDDHKTHTDPPLTELNYLRTKMPEDLINATLKLLLEKYSASTTGLSTAVGNANERPISPNAATDENDPCVSARHVPGPADSGGSEGMGEASGQGQGHEMIASPRPSSRCTVPSKTQATDKPSRHNHVSDDVTKVPLHTQGASHDLEARQDSAGSLHPPGYHRTDAKSAWNGYDAIYERQFKSENFQSNPFGNQIRDGPALDVGMANHPKTTSEYGHEDRYGSGFDDVYNDYDTGNPYRSNSYDMQFGAHPYQDQVQQERMRIQHLDEPYDYVRSVEEMDGKFRNVQDEYLPQEGLRFTEYALSERSHIAPSTSSFTGFQRGMGNDCHGYLPFQRRVLRDESPRALYPRPHTQGSSHGSTQQNLTTLPDQTDEASLSGFWKPHRLY